MVLEPITLNGDWVRPVCAYMYMSSRISGETTDAARILSKSSTEPETSSLAFYLGKPCIHSANSVRACSSNGPTHQLSHDKPGSETTPIAVPISNVVNPGGSFGLRPVPPNTTKGSWDVNCFRDLDERGGPGFWKTATVVYGRRGGTETSCNQTTLSNNQTYRYRGKNDNIPAGTPARGACGGTLP